MQMGHSRLSALLCLTLFLDLQRLTTAVKKPYVVYLGGHPRGHASSLHDREQATQAHYQFLESYLGSKQKVQDALLYSYNKYINGFAAEIEEEEAMAISQHPSVISVFPNRMKKLHTTRSWQFLGLEKGGMIPNKSIWRKAKFGEDVIIANLDSGVWAQSESFKDAGMGPIPSKWKGRCEEEHNISFCNRKLIAMRCFSKGFEATVGPLDASVVTARDLDGHGTHTLTTAGGRFVHNASIHGCGNGTAKGGSPLARVASYKVCWSAGDTAGCTDADILSGFDEAIHDGVDVLSVSLGGEPDYYFNDGIAIGAFHAVQHGIMVVCSAGNSGPSAGTVSNVAPWIFTVSASTMDRTFPSAAVLGNGERYTGQSLSASGMRQKYHRLINAEEAAASNATVAQAQLCMLGSLEPSKVKGKVVLCLRGDNSRTEKGEAVRMAGGISMILANDEESGNDVIPELHVLPATHLTYSDGLAVLSYLNSTRKPIAYITPPTTNLGYKPAPYMAAFSSQGPNIVDPAILKPDITAPGVGTLASYSPVAASSNGALFTVLSGTSMACPHISGIVGLLKSLHPHWSPSEIRSAIMTTARSRDNTGEPVKNSSMVKATPFSYGAGHVRPNSAMDPGLVYDLSVEDYLHFICTHGYDATKMAAFAAGYSCPSQKSSVLDLNYPSITVPSLRGSTTITRTVKNVGAPATYRARVIPPAGVSATVEPAILTFDQIGEEKRYSVTLAPLNGRPTGGHAFGTLIWSDGVHNVRSPIVVSLAEHKNRFSL